MMTFNAIDVETANPDYSSICQIGICSVINGEILDQWETLVNPETDFKPKNMEIHGIQEHDIRNAPTLPNVYSKLCERVKGSILVHYSHFDRSAFKQATSKYKLEPLPVTWLDCTKIVIRAWPDQFDSNNHKLKLVAEYLGIQFQHHNAVEDARATALIALQACRETGWDIEEFLHRIN